MSGRDKRGRFVFGASGNPSGRRRGTVLASTRVKKLIEASAAEIVEKMIALAKRGHPIAGRFLLERLIAPAKSAPIDGSIALAGSPAEMADTIIASLANGELTQLDAQSLLQAIHLSQGIAAEEEIQKRLAALESKLDSLIAGTVPKSRTAGSDDAP